MLCTTPFEVTARNIARMMGIADYPFALLAHPLGSKTREEIRLRAADAYEQALPILLGS